MMIHLAFVPVCGECGVGAASFDANLLGGGNGGRNFSQGYSLATVVVLYLLC
jgi:hypothetical protein